MNTVTDQYAAINQVRWLFDGVIGVEFRPKSDEAPAPFALYRISTKADSVCGTPSFNLTPEFVSMEDLEQFCTAHMARFKELSHLHMERKTPLQDTLFWRDLPGAVALTLQLTLMPIDDNIPRNIKLEKTEDCEDLTCPIKSLNFRRNSMQQTFRSKIWKRAIKNQSAE